jgi:hypothetical protein
MGIFSPGVLPKKIACCKKVCQARPHRLAARVFPSEAAIFIRSELFLGASSRNRVAWRSAVKRRGSQVVRRGSAKAVCVGSIPTLASLSDP